jgi:hypothetical protein
MRHVGFHRDWLIKREIFRLDLRVFDRMGTDTLRLLYCITAARLTSTQ